jgi:Ribonuclease G/E
MKVRVRGIYTTALTRLLLSAGHEVVQASSPIRRRFDADFETADHDVAVETTSDRQGIRVDGEPGDVADVVAPATDVGVDTFAWEEPAPYGAVFDGRVTDTSGGGARVDLGGHTGYLPFRNADGYVDEGDRVRVQVVDPKPPWDGDDPLLDGDVRAYGGLAALVPGRDDVTVDSRDTGAARELVGLTDLLSVSTPEGWGIRWRPAATEADTDALSAALERASRRAEALDEALDEPVSEGPRLVAAPTDTEWVWFGREARFGLDEHRRAVTATMPGHHRIKATSHDASAGVDFAEALCDLGDAEFPFQVVTDQFGPVEGDAVKIGHGKPDGRLIVLGEGQVVERDADGSLSVRREMTPGGEYDALGVPRESGDTALTKFREGRWWYPTVYRDADGQRKGTYVNVCTPVECFPDVVRYVDLHVDVVKHADGTVDRVDDDELDEAVERGLVAEDLAEKARSVATSIENAL